MYFSAAIVSTLLPLALTLPNQIPLTSGVNERFEFGNTELHEKISMYTVVNSRQDQRSFFSGFLVDQHAIMATDPNGNLINYVSRVINNATMESNPQGPRPTNPDRILLGDFIQKNLRQSSSGSSPINQMFILNALGAYTLVSKSPSVITCEVAPPTGDSKPVVLEGRFTGFVMRNGRPMKKYIQTGNSPNIFAEKYAGLFQQGVKETGYSDTVFLLDAMTGDLTAYAFFSVFESSGSVIENGFLAEISDFKSNLVLDDNYYRKYFTVPPELASKCVAA